MNDDPRPKFRVGRDFRLSSVKPGATPGMESKKEAAKATARNLEALAALQYRLYAENRQALLIVLQGIDAAGKDGTIRRVFSCLNPQGTRVTSFKVPTERERGHDFLWRVHQAAPGHGEIGIFNRSHYEDVLVVRVNRLAAPAVWKRRYSQINQFEALLHSAGTRVLKFFLSIDPDEQLARFKSRLETPEKRWKFSADDLEKRKQWKEYQAAFQDALVKCSTPSAPWYVIPANHKWYRDWLVSEITRRTLEDMNPQVPPPSDDLSSITLS